jgi:hypothetical protein
MTLKSIIDPKKKKKILEALRRMDTGLLPGREKSGNGLHSGQDDLKSHHLSRAGLGEEVTKFRAEFKSRVASLIRAAEKRNIADSDFIREINKKVKFVLEGLHEIDRDLCDQSIDTSIIKEKLWQIKCVADAGLSIISYQSKT